MKKVLFNIVIIMVIVIYLYNLYTDIINHSKPEKQKISITIPEVPLLQVEKVDDPVIQNPKLWNLKMIENLSNLQQESIQTEIQCVTYNPVKTGKIYTIKTSSGNVLKFFGVIEKKGEKYAVFYDSSRKEKKLFLIKEGERIDKFLLLKDIKNNNIILENLSNCPQKQTIILEILSVDTTKYKKLKEESR